MRIEPRSTRNFAFAAAAMACVLAACGAGEQLAGIEGSGAPNASSPITTVGTITGFGSIFVDGVEYATSAAQIRIDDQPATESQLHVGQIVTIKGSVNADGATGAATDVSLSNDVRGTVAQLDVAGGTLLVLGQTVRVTAETIFGDGIQTPDISGLQAGTRVQVSGFANAAGDLVASRIDAAGAGVDQQVRGKVQSLDESARTFRINALTVDYSGANLSGTIASGSVVIVQGTALTGGGALLATRVVVSPTPTGAANERGQVEGLITSFTSSSDFVVGVQRIATDANTQFILNGAVLAADVSVKVRGTFNAAGVLLASKVEAGRKISGVVRGLVDSVSASTLTVLGVTATITGTTALEDRSDQRVRTFRVADLRMGDYIELRGSQDATGGTLSAALVQRENAENRSYLQGAALNVAQPNLTVLGVTVTVDSQTQFLGLGGATSAAAEFFNEAAGQAVKIRGTLNGNTLIADRVQIVK